MAGNVTKVKEGSYRLRYKDYSRNVAAKSDRAAEKLLVKFITEVEAGNFSQPTMTTFENIVKKWLNNYAITKVAPKTLCRYKEMLKSRILPFLGNKRLEKIQTHEITEFNNGLLVKHKYTRLFKDGTTEMGISDGLSAQTILHHHRLICSIFEWAIRQNIFQGKNPGHYAGKPKNEKKDTRFYDEEQIAAMFQALEKEQLNRQAVVMIALVTGCLLVKSWVLNGGILVQLPRLSR